MEELNIEEQLNIKEELNIKELNENLSILYRGLISSTSSEAECWIESVKIVYSYYFDEPEVSRSIEIGCYDGDGLANNYYTVDVPKAIIDLRCIEPYIIGWIGRYLHETEKC